MTSPVLPGGSCETERSENVGGLLSVTYTRYSGRARGDEVRGELVRLISKPSKIARRVQLGKETSGNPLVYIYIYVYAHTPYTLPVEISFMSSK